MFLSFITYILIPAYTILFVQGSNWFTTNFSVIGNLIGRQEEFVLWGLIVGIYFFWCLRRIVRLMPERPRGTWLVPTSLVLLTFAITTPYLPEELPLKSFLHIIFAFVAAVCLMICLYLIVWKLYQREEETYRPYLMGLTGITLCSAFLLMLVGIVSSALEIFFTISTVVMVYQLYRKLCVSSSSAHGKTPTTSRSTPPPAPGSGSPPDD